MVRQLMRSYRRLSTTTIIAEELNLERETVRKIFTEDLEMRRISEEIFPKILTNL